MRKLLFVFCFLVSGIILSQSDSTYNENFYLTVSPSAIFNVHPGLQVGFEKVINENRAFEIEAARLYDLSINSGPFIEDLSSGYRVKVGYKIRDFDKKYFFLSNHRKFEKSIILFSIYYRHINHDIVDWVLRANSYEQKINYQKTKTLLGPTIGWGFVNNIVGKLKLESALNLGLGWYHVQLHNFPSDGEIENTGLDLYFDPGHYLYPIIGISLKLKMGVN